MALLATLGDQRGIVHSGVHSSLTGRMRSSVLLRRVLAGLLRAVGICVALAMRAALRHVAPIRRVAVPPAGIRPGDAICVPASHVCLSLARLANNHGIVAHSGNRPANPTACTRMPDKRLSNPASQHLLATKTAAFAQRTLTHIGDRHGFDIYRRDGRMPGRSVPSGIPAGALVPVLAIRVGRPCADVLDSGAHPARRRGL